MPVEVSALFERKYAPVAQWIEQLTSDYPGRCAVAPSVDGERNGPSYLLSSGQLRLRRDRQLTPWELRAGDPDW